MSDTPETDAQIFDACDGQGCEAVLAGFARKLERERNDALNKAHNYEQGYLTHAARADTLEKERNNLQGQRDFCMGEIERLRKEAAQKDKLLAEMRAAIRWVADDNRKGWLL